MEDTNSIWIRVRDTGNVVEVGRSAGNSMISGGFADQVDGPDAEPDHVPEHAADEHDGGETG